MFVVVVFFFNLAWAILALIERVHFGFILSFEFCFETLEHVSNRKKKLERIKKI